MLYLLVKQTYLQYLNKPMKVSFNINYNTKWGQRLYIVGSIPALGKGLYTKALPMKFVENGQWTASIDIKKPEKFTYRYFIFSDDKHFIGEWGDHREIALEAECDYFIDDTWRTNGVDKTFYSSAFTKGIIARKNTAKKIVLPKSDKILQFNLPAPRVSNELSIAILGNCKELGNWNEGNAVVMNDKDFPTWTASINADKLPDLVEYKYILYNVKEKIAISWESGNNRSLNTKNTDIAFYIKNDEIFRYSIANWKCTGVAIPVFSLRTKNSFGIGEFSDLKLMVDWAKSTGQKIIQTLPINDTTRFHTNADSYPYSSITVMGLHPIYINPFELGKLNNSAKYKKFEALRNHYNESATVMYKEVAETKWEYFRLIYKQEGAKVMASKEYAKFLKENKDWLYPYAAFCFLRDKNGSSTFRNWKQYSVYDKQSIENIFEDAETAEEANIHLYLQYNAHIQLLAASDYARQNGVVLKGDIPIGISPDSVEAWMEPELFNLDSQAGAPPDPFSETGQNWGFPTYNWDEMERDGYRWWKMRFKKMETYFQVYRIDHVLGFFRIWRMSGGDVQGLLGHFDPALPLDENEIRNYGMWFEFHRMVHPYIREYILQEKFGKNASFVKSQFLELVSPDIYRFKQIFNNQRKIEAYFKENKEELGLEPVLADKMYNDLLALHCEVLFIEDSKEKGKFHPRIGLHNTYSYRDLDWQTKNALNRLYDDFYYHCHNDFWKTQAMKKLPALLGATDMLVCAEDLGMIPECVPNVMKDLYMLSLEIERMPKDPKEEFVNMNNVPYLSVCTSSTHDMAPIRTWWNENRNLTQHYYNNILGEWGTAPDNCEPWICEKIVNRHIYSPAMLVILPFQDWISINGKYRRTDANEERINIPSDPHHFWCYRMHLSIEDLLDCKDLNHKILEMSNNSGRNVKM